MQTPEQTDTTLITEQIVSEQVLVRRKKDSNTSLDIPSPDKIRNEMQSLYSPISSLDTPPDLERAGHFELVPETAPSIHPNFSPITSPEESQSPDKQLHSLVIQPAERLSLVLQDPSIDVLPHKCSLALSDIVEEVCDSISDPLSPSLTYTRDESKPYTSPDSVFTDSSLMLSKALNSFMMSQGISEDNIEHRPAAQEHISDTTTELSDLISTQVLPAVEDLDFAQISASLLSIDQLTTEPTHQPPSDSTNS
ncbi:hypothetical protein LOD99_1346 [Oopsacas minuta]|uniref:Vertebrate heat shock transcription factor C-terminal domain-containing protein n=1 Tax=Oopsacas minuta TaxID=111878 RepID=A0AAV7K6E8_9METZ|nr:hypothetical protein LOD99_1346 [Oopsacas minuta]